MNGYPTVFSAARAASRSPMQNMSAITTENPRRPLMRRLNIRACGTTLEARLISSDIYSFISDVHGFQASNQVTPYVHSTIRSYVRISRPCKRSLEKRTHKTVNSSWKPNEERKRLRRPFSLVQESCEHKRCVSVITQIYERHQYCEESEQMYHQNHPFKPCQRTACDGVDENSK